MCVCPSLSFSLSHSNYTHLFLIAVDDDILLEVVMFVGVLCNEGTAPLLVESGLVSVVFVLVECKLR